MTIIRHNTAYIVLSAIIPFFIYLLTVAPNVVFFDSGELIASSFLISTAHPPGYPLYVLMGKLAGFLPFGNVAYRLNLSSAFFSSMAAATVFLITSRVIKDQDLSGAMQKYKNIVSLSTAITFAFSFNLWNQAVTAEVYPLNTFMSGLIIYILLAWKDHESEFQKINPSISKFFTFQDLRLLYLACFLFGLGIGNHHTLLVILPVIILVVAVTEWRLFFVARVWGISLTLALFGFSIYLLLPLRAQQNPELNWGDPDSLSRLGWVFFREGYPQGGLFRPWDLFLEQIKTFHLIHEFGLAAFCLGCLGIIAYFRKKPAEILITVSVILVLSLGIAIYGNPSSENVFLIKSFHTPSYLIFSIWIGAGIFFIITLVSRVVVEPVDLRLMTVLVVISTITLPASLLAKHYRWNDRSDDFIACDYAHNELDSIPSNSLFFTWGDSGAFPLWYSQIVERYQPGVLLIHTPHLSSKWYIDGLPDSVRKGKLETIKKDNLAAESIFAIMIGENFGKYPMFVDYSTRYSVLLDEYVAIPRGLVYELGMDPMKMTDVNTWGRFAMRGIYKKDPYRDLDTGKAVLIYGNTLFDAGNHLMKLGYVNEADILLREAVKISTELQEHVREVLFGSSNMPEGIK